MRHAGGLHNLGGTCYLNSILQLIRSANILLSSHSDESLLVGELKATLSALNEGQQVAPHTLLQRLQITAGTRFQIRQPNDLHEFFVALVDWITMSSTDAVPPQSLRSNVARSAWTTCLKGNGGNLTPTFYGLLRKTVRCGACNASYVNYETFSALTIDLIGGDGAASLDALLSAAFADRDLNADGGTWKCDSCGVIGGAAISSTTIERAPVVFTFAFNRYAGPHRKRGIHFPASFAINIKQSTKHYRCAGVAMHVGGASGGHCFAAAPTCNQGIERWALYDDDVVKELPGPPQGNSAIHVLMYARTNVRGSPINK